MTGLQYSILRPWRRQGPGRITFKGLNGREELFLFSADSMTELLEKTYGVEPEVVAVLRERRRLDARSAAYLQAPEGAESLVRGVWIKAGDQPLIYAFSLIPVARIDKDLLEILEGKDPEPIGRTLNTSSIPFTKQNLEAGVINCASVAEGLGLTADKPFFARRYVLTGKKAGAIAIKAAITEVFSPELIAADRLKS